MPTHESQRPRREGFTMGLYLCIVLAAEFAAVGDQVATRNVALAMIWGTTVGLALAHIFAFNLATRLFDEGRLDSETRASIAYQLGMAAGVAALLSIPLVFAETSTALQISSYMIAGIVGITAFLVARAGRHSQLTAIGFAALMIAAAVVVVLVKAAFTH